MSRRDDKRSARAREREAARAAEKLLNDRRRLAALEPGGSKQNPLIVQSASLIEPMATSSRCLRCNQLVRLEDHRVVPLPGDAGLLREVRTLCPWCQEARTFWMKIIIPLPS